MSRLVKSFDRLRRLVNKHAPDVVIERELGIMHQLSDLLADLALNATADELLAKG